MKATGIVRRIDDLGRVVIPKEIRRTLRIREGDPLEIYTEKDGEVIFKKYSPMGDLSDFAGQICDSIGKNTGRIAAVADRDAIIALAGAPRRELLDKRNSQDLEHLMEQRKPYRYAGGDVRLRASEASDRYYLGVAAPITAEGDLMGCVMLLMEEKDEPMGEGDQRLAQTIASFLGQQMES
ncbi:MAG: AbrB/MazE/SpoVT family DNA-binding domain-containing protein [Oscillospiraceae bacterium]|nr:AbrB/MazE/SpoVT family DNA-binding domain-containing protein [Oscillospiraceae bacterium]